MRLLTSTIASSAAVLSILETSPSKPALVAIRDWTIGRWVS